MRNPWLRDVAIENDAIVGKHKRQWELENSGLSPSDVQLFLRIEESSKSEKSEEIRQLLWLLRNRVKSQIEKIQADGKEICGLKENIAYLESEVKKERVKNDTLTKSVEIISESMELTSKDAHFLTIVIDELQARLG